MPKASELLQHIEAKLRQAYEPTVLEIIDNSWRHAGHVGNIMGGSHLAILLVSDRFQGMPPLSRHRQVRQVLAEELTQFIHALELRTLTPQQYQDLFQSQQGLC